MSAPQCLVYVVEDDEAVRDALRWLLETASYEVRTHGSAEELLREYDPLAQACILLDLQIPGTSGLEVLERHTPEQLRCPVVVVTGLDDAGTAVRAMKLGAIDYLIKPIEPETLLRVVAVALARDLVRLQTDEARRRRAQLLSRLTPRQRDVLHHLAAGDSNRMVATRLGLSVRTVETYRASIMEKLDAESLPELVRLLMAPAGAEILSRPELDGEAAAAEEPLAGRGPRSSGG